MYVDPEVQEGTMQLKVKGHATLIDTVVSEGQGSEVGLGLGGGVVVVSPAVVHRAVLEARARELHQVPM